MNVPARGQHDDPHSIDPVHPLAEEIVMTAAPLPPAQAEAALRAEVTALLAAADFAPSPSQFEEIVDAWPNVKAMLGRVRRDFAFSDEPAHVFVPLKF
jgi:copper homeostasis protein CutC